MSNKERLENTCPGYQFCIKGEDLKFFDRTSLKIFKKVGIKILPPEEEKEDVR